MCTASLLVLIAGEIYIRRKLTKWQFKLDERIHTQSDFCLMGHGMNFSDNSLESIDREIRAYLKSKFDINDIEYISPCFKNAHGFNLYKKQISDETKMLKQI